jgi:hypothetical protein
MVWEQASVWILGEGEPSHVWFHMNDIAKRDTE